MIDQFCPAINDFVFLEAGKLYATRVSPTFPVHTHHLSVKEGGAR